MDRPTPQGNATPSSAAARIDQAIADLGDWRGERMAEVRALIHEVDPDVLEEWKWMGTPVWSNNGMYVLANAFKKKVQLNFFFGAHLPDPHGLFNAGLNGNQRRAIDWFEGDTLDRDAVAQLLHEALAYNRTHMVPKKPRVERVTFRVASTALGDRFHLYSWAAEHFLGLTARVAVASFRT